MARTRLLPHRVARQGTVLWGNWWARLSGHRQALEDLLPGWDYASDLEFELQPTLDMNRLADETGVSDPAALDILVLLDCPATGARFTAKRSVAEAWSEDSNVITLQPPKGEVADVVRLSAHLVTNTICVDNATGGLIRAGSRLAWSDPHSVRLEGEDPRFPTEAVPFSGLGLEAAAWALQVTFTDLDEAFLGGVRLLVNTEHASSDLLLDQDLPGATHVQSILRADIARQLLIHLAMENFEIQQAADWPEGSVGEVLENMTELFLGSDLATTLQLVRSDYVRFERKIQDRFEVLKGNK